jgi:WD40 repeat protein
MCVLNNGLAQVFKCPHESKKDKMKPYSEEEVKAYIRKLDIKTELAIATSTHDKAWFVAGADYYMKKYTIFPNEPFSKVKWETPAIRADSLIESHALETTSYSFNEQHDLFVSGGKDGKVLVRTITDLMSKSGHNNMVMEIQTHSVLRGGVSALCLSRLGQFVYACGQDGSIFIESMKQGDHYPKSEVADGPEGAAEVAKIPTMQEADAEEIKFVIDIIQEEANRVNEEKKRGFKEEIMNELDIIAKNLRKLLD